MGDDRENLFHWRNHPDVRKYSMNQDEISWDAHCEWLNLTLKNDRRVLLIGESEGQPVGVLRYDLSDGSALVSIYLVPERMGQGYGAPLLIAGSQWLAHNRPSVKMIRAEIFPDNPASIKVFEKAAYKRAFEQAQQGILTYEYTF